MLRKLFVLCCFYLLTGCETTPMLVDEHNIATLTDTPAIQFRTSGWAYTNTTNPMLLTPNSLTNAMVGVSRFKPNEALPNNGPMVPNQLNPHSIAQLLQKKLADTENLAISTTTFNNRTIVTATYMLGGRNGVEYAFAMDGYLVHVILLATPGYYYELSKAVAEDLVNSIRAYVPEK